MNQILVTEKVIITPDFPKKKRRYKTCFFLSLFTACTLFSCCIYAEYDRNKSEQISQDMLVGIYEYDANMNDNTMISNQEEMVVINDLESPDEETITPEENNNISSSQPKNKNTSTVEYVASDGISYHTDSILKIPCLGIEYPVLSESSDALLKISLNKLHGPNPNEVGNYVIVGHNYKNGKMFGKLSGIKIGDTAELTDNSGRTVTYQVYDTYMVDPYDVSCTSQRTNGKKEITLITCNSTGSQRFVVKAQEI